MKYISLFLLVIAASLFIAEANAQATHELSWDKLSQAERDALTLPIRDRWDSAPSEQRLRMLRRAKRLAAMPLDERNKVRNGARAYAQADPKRRQQLRQTFEYIKTLPPEKRRDIMQTWRAMTPEQRRAWLDQGGPQSKNATE